MGGHQAGEIAARETIETLAKAIPAALTPIPPPPVALALTLQSIIEKTNKKIYHLGSSTPALFGMGTTLCCILWTPDAVVYAHVGDSRIYRLRQGRLSALTKDHSLYSQWLSFGALAERCETPFPYKNVITRAIGTSKKVRPDINIIPYRPNDLYLLCSDGLSDALSDQEMGKIIDRSENLELAAHRLIEKAKIKGSNDNITVLLVQCLDEPENIFRQQRHDTPRPEDLADDHLRSEQSSGKSL